MGTNRHLHEGGTNGWEDRLGGNPPLRLTVTDIERSRKFYTELLGFNVAVEAPASEDPKSDPSYPVLWGGCVMSRGSYLLGLRPVAKKGDLFDENRVGLDHREPGVSLGGTPTLQKVGNT